MLSRKRATTVVALAGYVGICSGFSLPLHIWVEGPGHEYEAQNCPVCHQLTYGSVAEAGDSPAMHFPIEAVYPFVSVVFDQQFFSRSVFLECFGPRAPPIV
jgi:hypothetical protein